MAGGRSHEADLPTVIILVRCRNSRRTADWINAGRSLTGCDSSAIAMAMISSERWPTAWMQPHKSTTSGDCGRWRVKILSKTISAVEQSVLRDPQRHLERIDEATDRLGDRVSDFDNPDNPAQEVTDKLTGRENALYRQLRNEERKLAHRMQAAEQLTNLGELKGDERLLQAADRLEEEALGHYTKRLQKIAEFQDRFGLPTADDFAVPAVVTP